MKKILFLLLFCFSFFASAQQITLKKGIIMDSISVRDSIKENFALYLPTNFDVSKKWPVLYVFDMEGRGKQALNMFRQAAEEQGYILAASNNVHDSITLSKNILISSRMFRTVYAMFPIKDKRSYTAGYRSSARLASLMPTFVKEIEGVISCGSAVANEEVLSPKNYFHFIGIVGTEDYNYVRMVNSQKILNKLKFPNQLLRFEGGMEWPQTKYLSKALEILTLAAIPKGQEIKNDAFVNETYTKGLKEVNDLLAEQKPVLASYELNNLLGIYKNLKDTDSLKTSLKTLSRSKRYRSQIRSQNAIFFKEGLIKDDYVYYLDEDVLTYNYNNLGWWKFQMDELAKFDKSSNIFEKQMGKRLKSFINALIADTIDDVKAATTIDEEALLILWMINTITDVNKHSSYLNIISLSSKVEDYGTALFYLEELLKTGYTNQKELYALEHTALLRISPEFNEVVAKYLKDARYETIEEQN